MALTSRPVCGDSHRWVAHRVGRVGNGIHPDGMVVRRSSRLVVSAELVEVSTGARLWSNTYDRRSADILSIQHEIASAIVDDGIRLRLTGAERRRLVSHPTADPEAYEQHTLFRNANRHRAGVGASGTHRFDRHRFSNDRAELPKRRA
jgi:hypothetical protein